MEFIISLVVTSLLLLLIAKMVPGFEISNWGSAIIAALILGVVNALVRPIMVFLTLPLTIVTLGLFLFIVNAVMLKLTAALAPGIAIKGFGPAVLAGLLLTVLNVIVNLVFGIS